MELDKGKPMSGSKPPSPDTSQTNGSHVVTPARNLSETEFLKMTSEVQMSSEYHLTARIENSQLSQREISLLAEVLEFQIVNFGANFAMMLALNELYFRLLGNKRNSFELNDGKVRTVCTVAEILIKAFRDLDFSLDMNMRIPVSNPYRELISPYLMTRRTYASRHKTWRPERFIRVRAVPVSALFDRDPSSTSQRYSGYTKGYGESHGNAHRKKTKPNSELDGEKDLADSEERNLIHRMTDPDHQPANSLWIKFINWLGGKL